MPTVVGGENEYCVLLDALIFERLVYPPDASIHGLNHRRIGGVPLSVPFPVLQFGIVLGYELGLGPERGMHVPIGKVEEEGGFRISIFFDKLD